jgi:hypothetical protein
VEELGTPDSTLNNIMANTVKTTFYSTGEAANQAGRSLKLPIRRSKQYC